MIIYRDSMVHLLYRQIKKLLIHLAWGVGYVLPVKKNKIVFDNFNGNGFGDSPKYIALELLSRNVDVDIVWLTSVENHFTHPRIRCVKWPSVKGIFELSTAHVWVDNVRKSHYYTKKRNQFYIQTWHGTYGGKKVENDAINILEDGYIKAAIRDSEHYDIFLTNSVEGSYLVRNSFWYNGLIVETGLPRNDVFFKPTELIREKILSLNRAAENHLLVLYAPTFRDGENQLVYEFDYDNCLSALRDKFKKEPILLIRLHPNLKKSTHLLNINLDNVINVTDYDDMQELLAASDILITDYSSSYLDFIMIKKPVFLYTPDYQKYLEQRDFYIPYEEIFIAKAKDSHELIKNITEFNHEKYFKENDEFLKKHPIIEDGQASSRVVDIVINTMKKN